MEPKYVSSNPSNVEGLDFAPTDSKAESPIARALGGDEALAWFGSDASDIAIRLLALYRLPQERWHPSNSELLFSREVYEKTLWNPDACLALTRTRAGGCAAFLEEPWCFVLHSPELPGPCISLALSCQGRVVKGVYVYNDKTFHPAVLLHNEKIPSSWRRDGIQIISLPQAVARAHASYVWDEIYKLTDGMSRIEAELIEQSRLGSNTHNQDVLSSITRQIQNCTTMLLGLQRRTRFHTQILSAIEDVTSVYQNAAAGNALWAPLLALKSQSAPFGDELETLAKRIDNARATMTAVVQQRDSELNLDIAESSRKMTQAALQDSASMKTIAILTMVFLPGTAIASFFSMSMFDWSSSNGANIASKWLWVFFVLTVPLTGVVVGVWYFWGRKKAREAATQFRLGDDAESTQHVPNAPRSNSSNLPHGPGKMLDSTEVEIELQHVNPGSRSLRPSLQRCTNRSAA